MARLPTGAGILASRMARAQRAAAPHKARAQLRALADRKALALDVPATVQPLSRGRRAVAEALTVGIPLKNALVRAASGQKDQEIEALAPASRRYSCRACCKASA